MAGVAQVAVLLALLAASWKPLGDRMARVYTDTRHGRAERVIYRLCRVDPGSGQRWTTYAAGVLGLSLVSVLLLYLFQRLQPVLPLGFGRGTDGSATVAPAMAFNTAVSFTTNTNWQSYVPEQVLGHTVAMLGLTVQNVLSAAVGMAVAIALVRGFTATGGDGRIGNVWVDVTRGTVRILLPLAAVAAVVLVATGVVQSLRSGIEVTGPDGSVHTVPLAPAASQEEVKLLGTNGGGIFNANSAHPFENPTPLSDLIEIYLMLVIPVALTRTFGVLVGRVREGVVLLAVATGLWLLFLGAAWFAELHPNGPAALAAGGALEGKETRFGIAGSVLFAVSTTGTSTGAVNAMHDSMTGAGGGIVLLNMLLGEVAPGGVGAGLYGILVMAVVAVFIAGQMVGRTPEYLGKKLGRREITCAAVSVLVMPALVLIGTGLTVALPAVTAGAPGDAGPHGFTELLYAWASAANNNGSAFAGLTATGDFMQAGLGVAMLLGRFLPILAVLCLAGSLAVRQRVPAGAGTLPTDGPLFCGLLGGTVLLVSALTFLPALALGPIAEALS
ncbi:MULTISPECIES: potassium-transporting ATPase subunit KdpA [Pseudonocardia]|uniref:Potassium-transporting ATPase potassium-binding subunit n=2 Tax=Pseudonocardia TaxID=1847 RepID=A0A1Y2N1B9_PSEAH|nr:MULTISPECIES: potassium-transporting ATPase subunit KdpA [Pseudonocardia]OSY41192.1 Potassium-transporting ATPase A chain [Pseudonocardia autotrophica]TDN76648.1 K+-transporting ATPase ATPase A chain [Pseudonocardia autotrophica]BBG00648.1 potassium-transporting ATPase potassium-binding subunit [Pseudonocardia autotrophica]GEC27998.1 potassium-transporting ATPase potassium-binding subunit [Pseudonocardia saturnea]